MLKQAIEKLIRRENLSKDECLKIIEMMLQSNNTAQIAAFLVALRCKNVTAEELSGMVNAFQQRMIRVPHSHQVLDIVGTGGDGANTVNISTGSAILAASCGVKIIKHGNRAVSSACGSADVLEALGVVISQTPEKISNGLNTLGIGFCFAPNFHPALRQLSGLRRELNIPTVFNFLGPLLNPASPAHLLLGVHDASLMPLMAEYLKQNLKGKCLVVHAHGLDEISAVGVAHVLEISPAEIKEYAMDPAQFGLSYCKKEDLQGGSAQTNAQILLECFSPQKNRKNSGLDTTLILNAATALYLYGKYSSIGEAISEARENLTNGSAMKLLQNWIEFSHDQ
jgi:anthranilate phosphoribosyltransferase